MSEGEIFERSGKGFLTIKEAKEYRCDDEECKRKHSTCRRCKAHVSRYRFDSKLGLCPSCKEEYEEWFNEKYLKPCIEFWGNLSDEEKKEEMENGTPSPAQVKDCVRVGKFVRENKIYDYKEVNKNG